MPLIVRSGGSNFECTAIVAARGCVWGEVWRKRGEACSCYCCKKCSFLVGIMRKPSRMVSWHRKGRGLFILRVVRVVHSCVEVVRVVELDRNVSFNVLGWQGCFPRDRISHAFGQWKYIRKPHDSLLQNSRTMTRNFTKQQPCWKKRDWPLKMIMLRTSAFFASFRPWEIYALSFGNQFINKNLLSLLQRCLQHTLCVTFHYLPCAPKLNSTFMDSTVLFSWLSHET